MTGVRVDVDPYLLDDADAIAAADPGEMLRAVAGAPAQFREAAFTAAEVDLDELVAEGRPRAIVVVGMGGSAIAGDVLAAVVGVNAPVQIQVHRGYGLPGWVGAADLVVAVSCSGTTEETLAATDEAVRRGCRLFAVGGADSPLADRAADRGPFAVVPGGLQPRASLWALSVPLIVLAHRLGLSPSGPTVLEEAAVLLESMTDRYGPTRDTFLNPVKTLAVALAGRLPMIWGSSPLAGVAAARFAGQLAENAKYPAIAGVLPEANHNQVVAFDGPFGAGADDENTRLHLLLLRDADEHPQLARRAKASKELAEQRGIPVDVVDTEGGTPIARLASLVAHADFTSFYLGVLLGVDPTPIHAIDELKAKIRP
jgi:glucose/mannose-6-phosphate isomerase